MKFKFIANACGVFTSRGGKTLLTDPWLNDGVFEGSWCHFHKLENNIEGLQDVDGIYLSHIHPDHFDQRFFKFPKNIPIFLLNSKTNFLIKNLKTLGYTNLSLIKSGDSKEFYDFKITLFAPFAKHAFYADTTGVGNIIDSALVIENDGVIAFNANDNTPDRAASEMIVKRFGKIDLLMHNYNNAGPYPACFGNLSTEIKRDKSRFTLEKNFKLMSHNIQIMKPRFTLPFAGAYVLGGKLNYKNEFLGTATWDECAAYINSKHLDTTVVCLRENDTFDLKNGHSDRPYIPVDLAELKAYTASLSDMKYPYESDNEPDMSILEKDVRLARGRMFERGARLGLICESDIKIDFGDRFCYMSSSCETKCHLSCEIDPRLLRRILNRESHWNNAEIGCHIEFVRDPDYYSLDTHTLLQFLHL